MEKQPHQEYRDELVDKLKEIRNSDPENPEVAKAKAQGYLKAKIEDEKYQSAEWMRELDLDIVNIKKYFQDLHTKIGQNHPLSKAFSNLEIRSYKIGGPGFSNDFETRGINTDKASATACISINLISGDKNDAELIIDEYKELLPTREDLITDKIFSMEIVFKKSNQRIALRDNGEGKSEWGPIGSA